MPPATAPYDAPYTDCQPLHPASGNPGIVCNPPRKSLIVKLQSDPAVERQP